VSAARRTIEATIAALQAQLAALPAETSTATPANDVPEFMTAEEYAARIKVQPATVRKMVGEGLPHVRPRARLIRVRVFAADAWLEARVDAARRGRAAARKGSVQ
jgi:hypothetical protein